MGPKGRQLFLKHWRQYSAGLQVASKVATEGQMACPGLQGELEDLADWHAAVLLPA